MLFFPIFQKENHILMAYVLKGRYTLTYSLPHSKEDNFYYFLLVSMNDKTLSNGALVLRKEFVYRGDPKLKRETINENGRVVSPMCVSVKI